MEEEGRKKKRMRRCFEKKRKEDGRENWKPRGYRNVIVWRVRKKKGVLLSFHVGMKSSRTNDSPRQQKKVIRTKFQMINFYRDKMGGLVSSGTKIQMTYNYRDEKHILPIIICFANQLLFLDVRKT
jgi:hypothetical protein